MSASLGSNAMPTVAIIELIDRWTTVPAGEWVTLRFLVTWPAECAVAAELPAGGVTIPGASLNTDLFSHTYTLAPGESVVITVCVRFDTPHALSASAFRLQVNPMTGRDQDRALVPFPEHQFQIVPSIDRALAIELSRICGYDDAVKVEVTVRNAAAVDLTDVDLRIGSTDQTRIGPLRRREPRLRPGDQFQFDLVVTGSDVDFTAAATIDGHRVERPRSLRVPADEPRSADEARMFTFLEPRVLTTDRVTLAPEKQGAEQTSSGGTFFVFGNKTRYILTIDPSHPQASSVKIYPAAGIVEVEAIAKTSRKWPFLLTVVENPTVSQIVRLDYDVQVQGMPMRGEIYLSIRPTEERLWQLAVQIGFLVTVKGFAALGPELIGLMENSDGFAVQLSELLTRRWLDWLMLSAIPLIRLGLSLLDWVKRFVFDET